ncbi:hypothetical protein [Rhodoflexus caldus]|uniref:hypothetical protein n=1 Tax=Rhodoflexus caldus TaxID=2891236 RepID=UPI002029E17A|nr:hypothetical protein [Rhodoflexus caldus]
MAVPIDPATAAIAQAVGAVVGAGAQLGSQALQNKAQRDALNAQQQMLIEQNKQALFTTSAGMLRNRQTATQAQTKFGSGAFATSNKAIWIFAGVAVLVLIVILTLLKK